MGSNLHWIWDSQTSFLRVIQSWLFKTCNNQAKITRNPDHSPGMRKIWRGIFLLVDFNSLCEKEMGQRMQWLLKV
ncbi:hypothetical protein ES332_D05G014500v1 [Gossypium tomentosum]|uniref:Uncharacterized protein n=1 Tax=Gossypium tomentosum TaxID=34277 RepID=A0A5D2KPQ8_GOSTO|nr:hypothetical protein ES332_D05G014500v1 [Gossypium tomentosum]